MTAQPQSAQAKKPARVFVECFATSDYGDSPDYAEISSGKDFIAKLKLLSELCKENNLSEVRQWSSPNWGGAADLNLSSCELVVTKDSFWFSASPKNSNYSVETRGQWIDEFMKAVESANGEDVFLGEEPQELANRVADCEETENSQATERNHG